MRFLSGFMAAGAVGLSLAVTAPVSAASLGDDFTIDQGIVPGATDVNVGPIDKINFSYSAIVSQQNDGGVLNGDAFTESGFYRWTGFLNNDNNTVPSDLNALGAAGYAGYGVFSGSGTASLVGGQILVTFTSFAITMYVDALQDTVLTLPADGSTPTGRANTGDDIEVGTATVLATGEAIVASGLANGDFEVILNDFTEGTTFFVAPDPFYLLTNFAGLTTNIFFPGTSTEGCASATAAFDCLFTGSGDQFFAVPEPGTLGLLGGGLLGAAALLRRRKAAKAA